MKYKSLNARAIEAGYHSYDSYIRSDEWKAFRKVVLTRTPGCRICGIAGQVVHHIDYERLGSELVSDVVVLCEDCHNKLHVAHREHRIPLAQFDRAAKHIKGVKLRRRRSKANAASVVSSPPVVIAPASEHALAHLVPQVKKLLAAGYSVNWMSQRYGWDKEHVRSLVVSIKADR